MIHPPQALVALERQKLGHFGAQHHAVPQLQLHILQTAPQRAVTAQHVNQPHARAFEQLHARHRPANQIRLRRDHRFGKKFHLWAIRQEIGQTGTSRQQFRGDKPQIEHAPEHQNSAQRCDFEDRKPRQPIGPRNPIDQKIGRGANQG